VGESKKGFERKKVCSLVCGRKKKKGFERKRRERRKKSAGYRYMSTNSGSPFIIKRREKIEKNSRLKFWRLFVFHPCLIDTRLGIFNQNPEEKSEA